VLSALDVLLRAQRKDGNHIALTWAVNERHPDQHFYVMRRAGLEGEWTTLTRLEGDVYSYVDGPVAPGRYLYLVSQQLPTGAVLMSNPAEAVILPEGAYLMVERRVRAVGEEAVLLWALPDGERPRIALTDAAGRILYSHQGEAAEGSLTLPSPTTAGVYFLQVETTAGLQTFRLVWQ